MLSSTIAVTQAPSPKSTTYREDDLPAFTPMPWSLKEIRAAIPSHLFVRDTPRGFLYFTRDLLMAAIAWSLASYIDPYFKSVMSAFSEHKIINDVIGFVTHSALWTPYFSWKISHHRHHSNHASMERDEVYVPKTRSDLGIPLEDSGHIDYEDYFGDTPIYTLFMLIRQQVLAFPAYLLFNVSGQKTYPKGTNHFDPNSILFTKEQRNAVILSNFGIAAMVWAVTWASSAFGSANVLKFYGIPWLLVSHWYLPHYRNKEWNFQRGAAATVDRNFLGWQGRFFLHDVAHFHVIHHFFPKMPFYNGPEATAYLKDFIGEHYHYSDKPVFKALWESYNRCQFVEDEGDVLFYRDKTGRAVMKPAEKYSVKKSR
ncbi:hypothetical protein EYR36_001129 [Pleurotus pulmonarius]|nr:hypothetical protein EYR36_004250 [Pleurotus pulmonarius]KAF4579319.1 hypothetical protein EYR36_001129 [Pleurotus pulmonarius]